MHEMAEATHRRSPYRHLRIMVAGLMAVGFLVLSSVPASAHHKSSYGGYRWDLTTTAGDAVGSYAHGKIHKHADGRVYIHGALEDTAKDGRYAVVRILRVYPSGNRSISYRTSGYGNIVYYHPDFAGSVEKIYVQEGTCKTGATYCKMAYPYRIW